MPKLSPEDQEKVDRYLSTSIHQVDRKPFRPWLLMTVIMLIMGLLTLIAWVIAKFQGVV